MLANSFFRFLSESRVNAAIIPMMTAAAAAAKGSRLVDDVPDIGTAVGGGAVVDAVVGSGVWMLYDPAELGLFWVTLSSCFGEG